MPAQIGDSTLHFDDRVAHVRAARVFDMQMRLERFDVLIKTCRSRLKLIECDWRRRNDALLQMSELIDIPHRLMHRAKLPFELREQVEMRDGEHLGVLQEYLELHRAIVCVHLHPRNVWNAEACGKLIRLNVCVQDGRSARARGVH
jgi:hypothetical protein